MFKVSYDFHEVTVPTQYSFCLKVKYFKFTYTTCVTSFSKGCGTLYSSLTYLVLIKVPAAKHAQFWGNVVSLQMVYLYLS